MITAKSDEPMVHNANDMGALRRWIRMPVENVANATTSAENWGSKICDAAAASIAISCPASMNRGPLLILLADEVGGSDDFTRIMGVRRR